MASNKGDKGFRPVRTTSIELYDVPENTPSSYIALAVFATVINIVFGVVAIFLSVSSISARKNGNMKVARQRGKSALVVSVVGIVVTCALVIFLVVYFLVIAPDDGVFTSTSGDRHETHLKSAEANAFPGIWRDRIREYTRPRWCEWYGYNSWFCKGPL